MTDLLQALPDFPTHLYSHLLPSLDKQQVTLSDLLTLDATDIARRAQLPRGEVRKLADVALQELQKQLGLKDGETESTTNGFSTAQEREEWRTISTLDDDLDAALGGGFPVRYLSEVVGESGAGKTQMLLTLLLSVQLPPSHGGLSASSIYISTESALSTPRLSQMLRTNPRFASLPANEKPSLSRVLTMQTPDLESQDHILRYQLSVAIEREGVKLIVIDSIAANYRAEFERRGAGSKNSQDQEQRRSGGKAMAARRTQLLQLGALLRDIARKDNVAIVVANQVADRFQHDSALLRLDEAASGTQQNGESQQSGVETPTGKAPTPSVPPFDPQHNMTSDPLTLDHQQRWFTGWGDLPSAHLALKTPSLGLVWTNQIAARVALIRQTAVTGRNAGTVRRWMRVVFAPWAAPTEGMGLEYEIYEGGLRAVRDKPEEEVQAIKRRKFDNDAS